MGRLGGILAIASLALTAATASIALATFTGGATASQTISTATLAPPTGLVATRPNATGPSDGNVALAWTPSATGIASGQTVLSGTSSSGPWTAIASLGATASAYTDATAPYNGQAFYGIQAARNLWTANSATAMSLSLPMAAGTDRTAGSGSGTALTGPWTTSGTQLAALSAPDGTRYTPGTWPAAPAGLLGADWLDATDAWVVGTAGTIQRYDGTGWSLVSSGTGNDLTGVSFPSTTTGWAVGKAGTILTSTNGGQTWSSQTPLLFSTNLNEVACPSTSACWAVGASGTIMASGTILGLLPTWSAQTSGTTNRLSGISCVSTSTCMAVGDAGTVQLTTNSGGTWTAVGGAGVTTSNLLAVSCVTAQACWAVGTGGTIVATANGGTSWTAQTSGTTANLTGIDMVSTTVGYAVGASGQVLTTTNGGLTWTALSVASDNFNAVSCDDTQHCLVVSTPGALRTTSNGGATWTQDAPSHLDLTPLAPPAAASIPLSRATVRLVYQTGTVPPAGTRMLLLVSADGGNTWLSYPLSVPTAAGTDMVQSIDVGAQVAGALASSLRLRYEVLPAGTTLTTAIDLVHVDAG